MTFEQPETPDPAFDPDEPAFSRVPAIRPRMRDGEPPRRRRRPRSRLVIAVNAILLVTLVGGAVGIGLVTTNTAGFGTRWQHLLDRIDLMLNPPPDRPIEEEVDATPLPVAALATPRPTATPRPGTTAAPTPAPTPVPKRKKVDVSVVKDPKAIFVHEVNEDMCAAAAVQIVLLAHGKGEKTTAFQRELHRRVKEWESYADSHNGKWGPSAMAAALAAYEVPGYKVKIYASRQDALVDAARAISSTGAPAILLAWRGAHAWVMSGYRASADPLVFDNVTVSGAYILDPWYPDFSSIWGQSDPPGAFQDVDEMVRNFLEWKRPEGLYPKRDGKYLVVLPTKPLSGS